MSDSSQPKNLYDTLYIDGKSIDDILKECTINLSGTGVSPSDVSINMNSSTYSYNTSYASGSTVTLTSTPSTYTIAPLTTTDTITLSGLDASSFTFQLPVEWKDSFPAWHRVEDMCEKYPGLKIAFENFKVVYEMVKDDYDNPVPKK